LLAPTSSGTTRYSITSATMNSRTTRRAGLAISDSHGRHSRQRLGDRLGGRLGSAPGASPSAGCSLAVGWPLATSGSRSAGGSLATGSSLATGASSLDRMLHSYPILPVYRLSPGRSLVIGSPMAKNPVIQRHHRRLRPAAAFRQRRRYTEYSERRRLPPARHHNLRPRGPGVAPACRRELPPRRPYLPGKFHITVDKRHDRVCLTNPVDRDGRPADAPRPRVPVPPGLPRATAPPALPPPRSDHDHVNSASNKLRNSHDNRKPPRSCAAEPRAPRTTSRTVLTVNTRL
jgi:hypothetical protein